MVAEVGCDGVKLVWEKQGTLVAIKKYSDILRAQQAAQARSSFSEQPVKPSRRQESGDLRVSVVVRFNDVRRFAFFIGLKVRGSMLTQVASYVVLGKYPGLFESPRVL